MTGIPPLGKIFPANSPEAVWLISLMSGFNDMDEAIKIVGDALPASNPPRADANGRLAYRLRLLMSHTYETYLVLANPPKNSAGIKPLMGAKMIPALASGRDITIEGYWQELKKRMTASDPQLQNTSMLDVLKQARDITFHYMEETRSNGISRIRSGLQHLSDEVVPIGLEGRWVIADEVRMQFLRQLGFITTQPFDVHLQKIPVAEIGYIVQSITKAYLEGLPPGP